jgi:hypothetical protein
MLLLRSRTYMSFEFVNIHICWRHFWKSMYHEIAVCYGHRCCLFLLFVLIWFWMVWFVGLWYLTPLATIFQLYRGDQFYRWGKSEYPVKSTDLSQVTDKLYDIIILEIFRHCGILCFHSISSKILNCFRLDLQVDIQYYLLLPMSYVYLNIRANWKPIAQYKNINNYKHVYIILPL